MDFLLAGGQLAICVPGHRPAGRDHPRYKPTSLGPFAVMQGAVSMNQGRGPSLLQLQPSSEIIVPNWSATPVFEILLRVFRPPLLLLFPTAVAWNRGILDPSPSRRKQKQRPPGGSRISMAPGKYILATALWLLFGGMGLAAQSPPILLILDPGHGGRDHGGVGGAGFHDQGGYVPEDACNYDVVARVARLAAEKQWKTAWTIIPESPTDNALACAPYQAFPPKREMRYNLPGPLQAVDYYPASRLERRQGLQKRLAAAQRVAGADRDAITIYLSVHFDYVEKCSGRRRCRPVPDPDVSGARVYTTRALSQQPFVCALARQFERAGLGTEVDGIPRPTVDSGHNFLCLRKGTIVPRVLVELGNFNNARDRSRMLDENARETYARVIIGAVEEYAALLQMRRSGAQNASGN